MSRWWSILMLVIWSVTGTLHVTALVTKGYQSSWFWIVAAVSFIILNALRLTERKPIRNSSTERES